MGFVIAPVPIEEAVVPVAVVAKFAVFVVEADYLAVLE